MRDFSNQSLKQSAKKSSSYNCFSLIGHLFASRNLAHILHLNSTSYAEHKALNSYYDSLLDLTDDLAETYIGIYGRGAITIPVLKDTNMVSHLKDLRSEVVEHREYISETNLQNMLDEILTLIDKTNYLLTLK
mgnify:CR=1 FL=1|jgi:hypothetical protein